MISFKVVAVLVEMKKLEVTRIAGINIEENQ